MVSPSEHLSREIADKTAKVGVIGLGCVPTPLNESRDRDLSCIGILGAAYKKDVDDPRESPSFKLKELLIERGAIISCNGPHIPVLPCLRHYRVPRLAGEPLTAEYPASQNCLLVATDHSAYDWDFIVPEPG